MRWNSGQLISPYTLQHFDNASAPLPNHIQPPSRTVVDTSTPLRFWFIFDQGNIYIRLYVHQLFPPTHTKLVSYDTSSSVYVCI